uniref:Cytochrome b5 heme-binding domain-containing protein n=1 Tax=Oryza rufipogon TaxID=4529 RepID=A0A0E0QK48_ORYRU
MAASVQPRQFGHLEPGSAPVCGAASSNGAKAYPPANGIPRRADSPVRGCGFPPLVSPPSRKPPSDGSDDEEEEQEDWRELYGSHLQLEVEPSVRDARDEGTADAWIERNPLLIRLTGKHPLNCEAPLARLMHHGFITPAALHFVRNHGAVPRGDWSTWTVEVTGLVKRPMRLTVDELRIIVTTAESDNYYHYKDNRVFPSHVDAELANADAWWYKPEYIINELNVNSVITAPGHDEILPINGITTQRGYTMKGYAYSGGGKRITRVEVTLDGGETWLVCVLDLPEKPTKYGKHWCWCFWSVEVEVLDLLGAKEIAVRAWDQSHNTQPEKLIWNLMGMMNNCWFKVKVNVCRPHKGEIGLVFEHPTQPGNQTGGWMARQKHLETAEAAAPGLKRSTSTPFMNTTDGKQFTMSEVRKHSSQDSAWIVVHGHVYDCTAFLKDHPGGADSILINAGTDCTEEP